MTKPLICACAVLLLLSPKFVNAGEAVNMVDISCKVFKKATDEGKLRALSWWTGYMNGLAKERTIDFSVISFLTKGVDYYCTSHPQETVPDALNAVLEAVKKHYPPR